MYEMAYANPDGWRLSASGDDHHHPTVGVAEEVHQPAVALDVVVRGLPGGDVRRDLCTV